ncbi:hypothetical protein EMCRGX_G009668 [Ephydatia muelleri]
MNRCKVCSTPVLQRRNRKKLGALSTICCIKKLVDLATQSGWDHEDARKFFAEGYVCLTCYRTVEKCSLLESLLIAKLSGRANDPSTLESSGTKRRATPTEHAAAVKVVVTQSGYKKTYTLSPSKEALGKSLGRNSSNAVMRHASHDQTLKRSMLRELCRMLRAEMKALLASPDFMMKDVSSLRNFSWNGLYYTMKEKAPTLVELLQSCIPQRSTRMKFVMVMCAAMLAGTHKRCTSVQSYVSIVLYLGHAAKQVYNRLQKLGICLSTFMTRRIIDQMGENHDQRVLDWVNSLKSTISTNQGPVARMQFGGLDNSFEYGSESDVPFPQPLEVTVSPCSDSSSQSDSSETNSLQCPNMSPLSMQLESPNGGELLCGSSPIPSHPLHSPLSERYSDECTLSGSEKSLTDQPSSETVSASEDDSDPTIGWCGFRIVGDNIDKTVRPRDMRHNHQSTSLHYFHSYAVKDRVDVSDLSPEVPLVTSKEIDVNLFLPSPEDCQSLEANFCTLMMRILVKHIPGISHLSSVVLQHIPHPYSVAMSKKSEVVPLGVLLKNENKLDDMMDILDGLHKYVPSIRTIQHFEDPEDTSGEPEVTDIEIDHFCQILIGGDQLTAARVRGSQSIRRNSDNGRMRLDAFIPVVEDWHTKMCFMQVLWSHLYKATSTLDVGTLYQLKILINRRNVSKDVKKDMNACEDFLELVTSSHVIAAALHSVGVSNSSDFLLNFSSSTLPSDQQAALESLVVSICSKFINISYPYRDYKDSSDHILKYTMEVMSLGLLYLEFKDAVREGDGFRVLRCWKFFFLLFRGTGHKNYCIEALQLLASYYYILPPRYAAQMLWGRFVNIHGKTGCKDSADLHMEHLNRLCRDAISHLGANKTPSAISKVGKALGPLSEIITNFDAMTGTVVTKAHTRRSEEEDLNKLVTELVHNGNFHMQPGRFHQNFKSIESNQLISSINVNKFRDWMMQQLRIFLKEDHIW